MTAIEWFFEEILKLESQYYLENISRIDLRKKRLELFDKAKEIENKTTLRNQLFIGKIHEVLGYDKTIELLKECYNEYPL